MRVISLPVNNFRYFRLTDNFRAPKTGQLSGIEGASVCYLDASFNDTAVFSVETFAAENNCADGVAVTANRASSVIAVDRTDRSAVITGREYPFIFHYNRSHCLFDAPTPNFQNFAD
jgi:hypothetical protein